MDGKDVTDLSSIMQDFHCIILTRDFVEKDCTGESLPSSALMVMRDL